MEFSITAELDNDKYELLFFSMLDNYQPSINQFLLGKTYGDNLKSYLFVFNTLSPESQIRKKENEYHKKSKLVAITKKMYSDNLLAIPQPEAEKKILLAILESIREIPEIVKGETNAQKLYDDLKSFFTEQAWI